MSRKKIKLILLITGLVFAAIWTPLFIINNTSVLSGLHNFMDGIIPMYLLLFAAIIPLTIVSLMHSRDIRETKRGLSSFLKGLAYFWIITGSLNAAALIVISIFFIR